MIDAWKKMVKKKYLLVPVLLMIVLIVIVPSLVFGLERVGDYYSPKPSEEYSTDNGEITRQDLLYTGSHVGVIRGAKTGTIPMGSTPLLRAADNSSLGYAFYKPSELRSLATSLNGNPDYVVNNATKTDIYKTINPSNRETWVWARDLGRATGATVDIEETGQNDESGLPRLRVVFNTSEYPSATFTNNEGKTPSKVKTGDRFYAFVAAEEYDPYQSQISWELKMNGKVIDSASGSANRSVRNVPIILNETGTHTLTLTVTDGIERKTVLNHTITATKDAPPVGTDPDPEPEPEPVDPNLPPEVTIYGPTKVKAGEEFSLFAAASDKDGEIVKYIWDFPGADGGEAKEASLNNLYYMDEGEKFTQVYVEDDKGAGAGDYHFIEVVPPTPEAYITVDGTLKENRKVKISSSSRSPKHFPITTSYFTIEPLDGQNINSVYTHAAHSKANNKLTLSNSSYAELLFKETGKYKVYHYVKNTAGLDDETEQIIIIGPDLVPLADFSTVTTLYRENLEDDPSSAQIKLTDLSKSTDDVIAKRVWTYQYDSNNDGNFDDEEIKVIDDTNQSSVAIDTDKVGKYKFELLVVEEFAQETIESFVTQNDRKRKNTDSKSSIEKIVEVKNLAPVVSFDVQKKKKVELAVALGQKQGSPISNYDRAFIETKINDILKPTLSENNLELKVHFLDTNGSSTNSVYEYFGNASDNGILTAVLNPNYNYQLYLYTHNAGIKGKKADNSYWSSSYLTSPGYIDIPEDIVQLQGTSGGGINTYYTRLLGSKKDDDYQLRYEYVGSSANGRSLDQSNYDYRVRVSAATAGMTVTGKRSNGTTWSKTVYDGFVTVDIPKDVIKIDYVSGLGNPERTVFERKALTLKYKDALSSINDVQWDSSDSYKFFSPIHDLSSSELSNTTFRTNFMNSLDENDIAFTPLGTSLNQSQFNSVINEYKHGRFFDNTKMNDEINELAKYILDEVNNRTTVDIDVITGITSLSKDQIETKIKDILIPKLKEERVKVNLNVIQSNLGVPNPTENVAVLTSPNNLGPVAFQVDTNKYDYYMYGNSYDASANIFYGVNTSDPEYHSVVRGNNFGTYFNGEVTSQLTPYNGSILRYSIGSYSPYIGARSVHLQRRAKEILPSIKIAKSDNEKFVTFIHDRAFTAAESNYLTSLVDNKDYHFLGLGNSTNKNSIESFLQNHTLGKYIENSNYDSSIQETADYIIEQIKNKTPKVDLTFGVGNTVHGNKNVIQTKINEIIVPKLNNEGIRVSSVNVSDARLNTDKAGLKYWEYVGSQTGLGNGYMLPTSNAEYKFIMTNGVHDYYYVMGTRRDNGVSERIGLYYPSGYNWSFTVDSRIYSKIQVSNNYGGNAIGQNEAVIRKVFPGETYNSSGGIWEYVGSQAGLGNGYTLPSSNETYNFKMVNGVHDYYYVMGTRRDNGVSERIGGLYYPSGYNWSFTVDSRIYSKIQVSNNYGGNAIGQNQATTRYRSDIPLSINLNLKETKNLQFAAIVEDNVLGTDSQNVILKQTLATDSYISGLGKPVNKPQFQSIIDKNMERGTFVDNSNLEQALNNYADYIIQEIKRKIGTKELYITLEEEVEYFTTYEDAENDPKYADRWRYAHNPNVFENNTGQDNRHMRDLGTPIEKFLNVGRYQPFYSANDDPLTGIIAPNNISFFENYRKWAKDADNWFIYVHRKPVPEFSFTMNNVSRTYTLTNQAYDLDKHSINIGFGPGIKKQKFEWRIKGDAAWTVGQPPSPLSLTVYEIKNTVTDFQNREESKIKEMNATGLNVPPVPEFEIIPDRIPQSTIVKPKNFSWDPNGDAINGYLWQWKEKGQPDSAFVDIPGATNIKEPNIPFNTVGTFVIRLKVKDVPGLWSAPPREWHSQEVVVYSPNTAPVAGFEVTPTQYVGEAIKITSTATDSDGDILSYEYTVTPPNGTPFTFKTGQSYLDRKGNSLSISTTGDFSIQTYDETDIGTWTITQKVIDPMGASAEAGPKQAVVLDLTISGYVTHTEAWEKIHEEKGNLPHQFYSGEKFILHADVLPRPIRSVTVNATGRLESNSDFNGTVPLAKLTDILYNGEYFEARFAEVGTQIRTDTDVIFTFTVVYENGTEDGYSVTDTVTVRVIGSALGLLELHQVF